MRKISAYHNVDPKVHYPATLIKTSQTDDRVHPAHARKMAARLFEYGNSSVYFYESTDKGHGNSDFNNWISEFALAMSFFWRELSQKSTEQE